MSPQAWDYRYAAQHGWLFWFSTMGSKDSAQVLEARQALYQWCFLPLILVIQRALSPHLTYPPLRLVLLSTLCDVDSETKEGPVPWSPSLEVISAPKLSLLRTWTSFSKTFVDSSHHFVLRSQTFPFISRVLISACVEKPCLFHLELF